MPNKTWSPEVYVQAYKLAKQGLGDMKIAEMLGVSYNTFKKWIRKRKALRLSLEDARNTKKVENNFQSYVYERLPKKLKKIWNKILACEKNPNLIERVEAMLAESGKVGRQSLFVHALVHYNFSCSNACKAVNISKATFDRWILQDPDFAELIDEIQWHKANFFDSALVGLVREGNAAAIMFVNRTYNAKRGYGIKKDVKVDVSGSISHGHDHKHSVVPIDSLNLPIEVRKAMLEKARELKALPANEEDFKIQGRKEIV